MAATGTQGSQAWLLTETKGQPRAALLMALEEAPEGEVL